MMFMKAIGSMIKPSRKTMAHSDSESSQSEETSTQANKPVSGFCLRCASIVPADPGLPYCGKHFAIWSEFKNYDYKENHCHICGNKYATTMRNPLCNNCARKYECVFTLASG